MYFAILGLTDRRSFFELSASRLTLGREFFGDALGRCRIEVHRQLVVKRLELSSTPDLTFTAYQTPRTSAPPSSPFFCVFLPSVLP